MVVALVVGVSLWLLLVMLLEMENLIDGVVVVSCEMLCWFFQDSLEAYLHILFLSLIA